MNTQHRTTSAVQATPASTSKSPVSRREINHRVASLGLAVLMTLGMFGSIELMAGDHAADSLLAQQSPLLANASASAAASAPRV